MSETVKKNNTELCKLKLSTTPSKGFEIFIQSNHNFSFLAEKGGNTFALGNVKCFKPRGGDGFQLAGVAGYFQTGAMTFESDGRLNLSILLAQDLEKGVTFNFGVFPLAEDKIMDYISKFKEQIKMIYLTYMKPVSVSVTFSTETVETENHD